MTRQTQFPVGCKVRLIAQPEFVGEVLAVEADGTVRVTFRVGDMLATGRHSATALEVVGHGGERRT
ncbi:MAG: hypothetical protein ACYCOU_05460 [Sulfobacillus sp.]